MFEDDRFLLRLKQKNYGKWYMNPETYGQKIDLLKRELAKVNEMKN